MASETGNATWSDYVKELMRLEDWTQAELAEEVGCTQSTVSKWISGKKLPAGSAQKMLLKLGGH